MNRQAWETEASDLEGTFRFGSEAESFSEFSKIFGIMKIALFYEKLSLTYDIRGISKEVVQNHSVNYI